MTLVVKSRAQHEILYLCGNLGKACQSSPKPAHPSLPASVWSARRRHGLYGPCLSSNFPACEVSLGVCAVHSGQVYRPRSMKYWDFTSKGKEGGISHLKALLKILYSPSLVAVIHFYSLFGEMPRHSWSLSRT